MMKMKIEMMDGDVEDEEEDSFLEVRSNQNIWRSDVEILVQCK